MGMNLALAEKLLSAAKNQASVEYNRPITVSVCDAYGLLVGFLRMDGAPLRTIEIAQGKAYSATRMGTNTDAFLARLARENVPASYFCDSKLTALPGGAVIKDGTGTIIGGIGISGLAPSEDQALANQAAALALP